MGIVHTGLIETSRDIISCISEEFIRMTIEVSASLLAADYANLAKDVALAVETWAIHHFDVMDGHYVPNLAAFAAASCALPPIHQPAVQPAP